MREGHLHQASSGDPRLPRKQWGQGENVIFVRIATTQVYTDVPRYPYYFFCSNYLFIAFHPDRYQGRNDEDR